VTFLTEPYKVTTVRLDHQGISDNIVAVQCVELNALRHEIRICESKGRHGAMLSLAREIFRARFLQEWIQGE
jgi:hypothetical protein